MLSTFHQQLALGSRVLKRFRRNLAGFVELVVDFYLNSNTFRRTRRWIDLILKRWHPSTSSSSAHQIIPFIDNLRCNHKLDRPCIHPRGRAGHSPYPSPLSLNIPIFIRMRIPCNKFNLINNRTQLQQQQQMDMQIKSGLRTHITITRKSRKMIG